MVSSPVETKSEHEKNQVKLNLKTAAPEMSKENSLKITDCGLRGEIMIPKGLGEGDVITASEFKVGSSGTFLTA